MGFDYYWFNHQSSPVDWCEENYAHHSSIAEFFNTFSNIPFFIIPAISIYLYKEYSNIVTKGVHVIFLLLIAVGTGSFYFHSTLSLVGQLMDELFILWVLIYSYALLFPERYLTDHFKRHKRHLYFISFVCCMLITSLCCYHPYMNAYFLLVLSWPAALVLYFRMKTCHDSEAIKLCKRIVVIWIVSVLFWILDRLACSLLIRMNFNYFHSIFHVLAIFSAQWTATLFLFFTAIDRYSLLNPVISYWGEDCLSKFNVFIPYVSFANLRNIQIKPTGAYKDA